MSSWYSSWLPGLPSIEFALPTTIQRHFISFVLKRSLGHFVKPGQLDAHLVDSQIGSGYVQVRDLQLHQESINKYLLGLPMKLQEGTIRAVTARIPWPNPLTSTVGFSLHGLDLTFDLTPEVVRRPSSPPPDLAASVASVAESFIHDELNTREEATLRESFQADLAASMRGDDANIPGGIDPFISADRDETSAGVDPSGISIFAALIERLLARFAFDATDVSITIVYPGHSSITLNVKEIKYGTEGSETTESTSDEARGETRALSIAGVTIMACDLRLPAPSSPLPVTPSTTSQSSPVDPRQGVRMSSGSASPASSSSSLDEDTQLMMSQSLAFLPPRAPRSARVPSPVESVSSSMYQSAISTALDNEPSQEGFGDKVIGPGTSVQPPNESTASEGDSVDETGDPVDGTGGQRLNELIISMASEPFCIRLTTPPPTPPTPSTSSGMAPTSPVGIGSPSSSQQQSFKVSITCGVFACALNAWHIRAILDLLDAWGAHEPSVASASRSPSSPHPVVAAVIEAGLDVTAKFRGVVILVLPTRIEGTARTDTLLSFWGHPLMPPLLPHSYVRAHLEGTSAAASVRREISRSDARTSSTAGQAFLQCNISTRDISVFVFRASSAQEYPDRTQTAVPVLISDPRLPAQYPIPHSHPEPSSKSDATAQSPTCPTMPAFDITDWTEGAFAGNSSKKSTWRSKASAAPHHGRRSSEPHAAVSPSSPTDVLTEAAASRSAITASIKLPLPSLSPRPKRDAGSTATAAHIAVVPLHFFVDVGMILDRHVTTFLDEFIQAGSSKPLDTVDVELPDSDDDGAVTPPAPSALTREIQRDAERRRLERLVLEDLDLTLDYREPKTPTRTSSKRKEAVSRASKDVRNDVPSISVNIKLDMVRIEVRCPSPLGQGRRSGALVVDLHELVVWVPPPQANLRQTRFATEDEAFGRSLDDDERNAFIAVEFSRLLVASSVASQARATGILSLGALREAVLPGLLSANEDMPVVRPRVFLARCPSRRQPNSSRVALLVAFADLPSVYVHLTKASLDGVQYWADDIAQLLELRFGPNDGDTEKAASRDPSIIGSRFFAKSRRNGSGSSGSESGKTSRENAKPPTDSGEVAVKVRVSEAFIRLPLPRVSEDLADTRPFDVSATKVDALMELKPDGKDETVMTIEVSDIAVSDTSANGEALPLLLTGRRSLFSTPKPLFKLRFTSFVVPGTTAKESRVKLTLWGFITNFHPQVDWAIDLGRFVQSPPGTFESVIPSERTQVMVKVLQGSIRVFGPKHSGSLVVFIEELDFSTDLVGESAETTFTLLAPSASVLFTDDNAGLVTSSLRETRVDPIPESGSAFWKTQGFALLSEVTALDCKLERVIAHGGLANTRINVDSVGLRIHLCADTGASLGTFISDLVSVFKPPPPDQPRKVRRAPTTVTEYPLSRSGIMSGLEENAFRKAPEIGPAPDFISDDLPTNPDYLDDSFSAAAGLRELRDDDVDDFDLDGPYKGGLPPMLATQQTGITSKYGGETIKMIHPISVVEDYFNALTPELHDGFSDLANTTLRARVHNCSIELLLYEGYDWSRTRKIIEDEVKNMKRRLAKIKQLVAAGQTQDPSIEDTSALLFNSVYIGLDQDAEKLDRDALVAAIDDELNDDLDATSQSSWQSLRSPGRPANKQPRLRGKRLTRSRGPSIEIRLSQLDAAVDQFPPGDQLVSRILGTVKDLEILDHIKTSTWKKFLTDMRSDSKGNIRETDSNMVRVELKSVRPVPGHPSEEARLRAKILPLRLHVDQDALDFLKKFFSFKDSSVDETQAPASPEGQIYFQHAEVFPVGIKLDYKPRRVDYRALREGRTIELMNFFHFDGAEMTLRHITLSGITGWPRFFDLLNDLWTPDVKATQLVDVISGVSPIRSMVNVGSGVADLVLLPIAQYKKDGRIVRGVQKGTSAFVKSTAMEAIKLGARLATGTQVILEQAETVFGANFGQSVTAETLQVEPEEFLPTQDDSNEDVAELISRYAEQPASVQEGVQGAYRSLQKNLNSAAQTILAVPMEVYERSGNEGPVRSVIRAVPIAVLKPMIGASEAVSKTLMGLHNTLDPNVRHENEAKYKQR